MAKPKIPDEKASKIPVRRTKPKADPEAERAEAVREELPVVDAANDTRESEVSVNMTKQDRAKRENVLDEIYHPEEQIGRISDVQKIDQQKQRSRKLLFSFIILSVLAAAAVAGYFVFARGSKFSERVTLAVNAPADVAAGDQVTLSISIKNEERIALRNAELTFNAPDGFTFQSSTPAASNEFNNAWSLGTLQDQAGTTVTVTGRLLGNQLEEKTFSFTLGYRPADFNYDFQKTAETKVKISSSVLRLTPEVPLRIIPGTPTDIPVTIENTSADALTEVTLVAEYPEAFTFTKADPKPSEKTTIWNLPDIPANGKVKVTVTGTFKGNPGDTPELKFRAGKTLAQGLDVQAEANGIGTLVQAGMSLTTKITNPGSGAAVGWGDTLNYIISYKNDSEGDMKDVTVILEFSQKNAGGKDVSILDLDKRSGSSNGKLEGRTLAWTKQDIPALGLVKASTGGDILLRITVASGPEIKGQDDRNFVVTTASRVSVGSIEGVEGKNFETQAEQIATKITSKLNVEAEGRFYNDEQLPVGTGPLPPQVGQTTTYQLSWSLTNPTNEVTQVVVAATLPENVAWSGTQTVTAGQAVTFDATTREITWRINRVPPGTGSLFASLEATFKVSITPLTTDLGQLLLLLNKTVVTARDEFTTKDLRLEKAIVTTDLTTDVAAQGKGLVVAAQP
ncbi:MAG: hypothetical protein AAB445_03540 [Patescibacteria group bacterium]